MITNRTFISSAVLLLQKYSFLESLERVNAFHDEPHLFCYEALLQNTRLKEYPEKKVGELHGIGYSFFSPAEGLARCLGESLERLCSYTYQREKILYLDSKSKSIVDPSILDYFKIPKKVTPKLGFVEGTHLTKNKKILIPAQLVYLNYLLHFNEPILMEATTTGSAGGLTQQQSLLGGIYETVERDSFMTFYLGKMRPTHIDFSSLTSKKIHALIDLCQRYHLEPHLFETTTDLGIPSFTSLLIDRTGIGPALTIGMRAGLDTTGAILSSLEESIISRQWIRRRMLERKKKPLVKTKFITTLEQRALYWTPLAMLDKMSFFLQQPYTKISLNVKKANPQAELDLLKAIFQRNHIHVYYTDITPRIYKEIPYHVTKVIIPQLQPLYLNEKYKSVNLSRIQAVAKYYNQQFTLNDIPHPML